MEAVFWFLVGLNAGALLGAFSVVSGMAYKALTAAARNTP